MKLFGSNSFFARLFNGSTISESKKVNLTAAYEGGDNLPLESIATAMCISFISSCVSAFEFSVILNGQKSGKEESYLLNVSPNHNQSAPDFWQSVAMALLLFGDAVVFEHLGSLYLADSFNVEEQAFAPSIYSIEYSRDSGSFSFKRTAMEVLHFKLPGGFIPSASSLFSDFAEIAALAKDGYVPDDRYTLDISSLAQGSPDFDNNYNAVVNEAIVPFLKSKKAVLPLFDGFSLNPVNKNAGSRSTSEATDHANMITEAIKKAANLYHIPPALLLGTDASTNDGLVEDFMSFCLAPIARIFSVELTRKRLYRENVINDCRIVCSPAKVLYFDILRKADKVEKLIGSGYYTIDELRERTGELRTGEPVCSERLITKNFNTEKDKEV